MCVATLVLGGSATADSGTPARGSWGAPQMLAPITENVFHPQLAVTANGQVLAGWLSGEPPPVASIPIGPGKRHPAPPTKTVVVDRGTVAGGFQPPTVLSATGFNLQIAVSGTGTAYAVWENAQEATLIATAAPRQPFSAPRELLPRHTSEVRLVQSPSGPVVVVWATGAPGLSAAPTVLQYARLRADGTLETAVTAGTMVEGEGESFALNDRGAFAAIGYASERPSEDGLWEDLYLPFVAVCDPEGRCSQRHLHKLGRVGHDSLWQLAIALSEDGTANALASYETIPSPVPSPRNELWDAVRRPDGRWGTERELSGLGGFPVVTPYGRHGALTVFQTSNPEGSLGGLAWSLLPANGDHFAKPVAVSGPNSREPPTLAASATGEFVIAWHAGPPGLVSPTRSSLAAAVGTKGHLGPAKVLSAGNVAAQTIHIGIDRAGEAIVSWSDSVSTPSLGIQPRGLFVVVHRP